MLNPKKRARKREKSRDCALLLLFAAHMGVPGNVCACVCVWLGVCLESEWYLEVLENSCQQLQFLGCNYAGRVNNCNALLSCLKLRRRYFCIFHAEFCLCAPQTDMRHTTCELLRVCVSVCVCLCVFVIIFGTASDTCFGFKNSFCVSIPSLNCTTTFSHFSNFPHFPKIFYELFPYFNENNKKGMGSFPSIISGCQLSAAFPSNYIHKYISYL